jgi:hypothetical protein
MSKLPPHIIRALRQDIPAEPDAQRLARLASSIEGAAAPLLAARRRAEPGWWELPAAWAATLIPVSLVLAMASLLVLWRVEPPRPAAAQQVAQATADQVMNDLVTSPPR